MLNGDVVAVLLEHVPDEIRKRRDTIAREETEHDGHTWEHHRELYDHINELRDACEKAGHPLIIALTGKPGTRRRLMRNGRDERRTCIMCGTEEVGTIVTRFFVRFLLRRAAWKFERLNGYVTRTFSDAQWYFEIASVIRHFSFSTDVVLYHAFPPKFPPSLSGDGHKRKRQTVLNCA